MRNVIGVLLACAGLWAAVWAVSGSHRWSTGVAGLVLFAASVAVLVDVEDVT